MFWDNYCALCEAKGESPTAVAEKLGFTSGSVSGWKKGAIPRNPVLKKIADYFGVTVADLKANKPITIPEAPQEDPLDNLRFALYGDPAQDVTREQLEDVKRYAAYIRERGKEQK